MTALNFFEPAEDSADDPEFEETGCQCPPGDNRYNLEIEEGQANLVHAACGKQPPSPWGDWHDLVVMDAISVTLEWVPECDGSMWHGEHRCDCGSTVRLTPVIPNRQHFEGQLASTQIGACTNCGAEMHRWCEVCASCPTGCYGGHPDSDPCPQA